ncbi:hypothetical protein C8R46DRAFT_1349421 [Mycena filopes]|nr:hypothetical protein C8R46DRAFT_1349421 [Mycena filopes]
MASIVKTAVPATTAPALARALPYAQSFASIVVSSLAVLLRAPFAALAFLSSQLIAHPGPFHLLLYILAPAIIFVQLALEVFVYFPYRVAVYAGDALYPIYVLVGVAVVTGGLLGLSGRIAVLGATLMLEPTPTVPLLADVKTEEKARRVR